MVQGYFALENDSLLGLMQKKKNCLQQCGCKLQFVLHLVCDLSGSLQGSDSMKMTVAVICRLKRKWSSNDEKLKEIVVVLLMGREGSYTATDGVIYYRLVCRFTKQNSSRM